eukprot:GEZU01020390.1.p1 GENE.GEZU01020390.1~~GEZU01020390.1.p1  ORF type:complete len:187 (+),score=47.94 GEZU01020390.1:374-934(+)
MLPNNQSIIYHHHKFAYACVCNKQGLMFTYILLSEKTQREMDEYNKSPARMNSPPPLPPVPPHLFLRQDSVAVVAPTNNNNNFMMGVDNNGPSSSVVSNTSNGDNSNNSNSFLSMVRQNWNMDEEVLKVASRNGTQGCPYLNVIANRNKDNKQPMMPPLEEIQSMLRASGHPPIDMEAAMRVLAEN